MLGSMTGYEESLIRRSQAGDLESFNLLVERYQTQVYNLALRMLGNHHDAEDTTQETFVSAWKSIPNFHGNNFRAWLLRIAANACIDLLRTRKGKRVDPIDVVFPEFNPLTSEAESPEDHVLREELAQLLSQKLLELPPEQRLVVTLADLQGLSYEEISQILGCSLGTVKSRLSRGRAHLRCLLLAHPELLPPEFRL